MSRDPIGVSVDREMRNSPRRTELRMSADDWAYAAWVDASYGLQLYAFVVNRPMDRVDVKGLFTHTHGVSGEQLSVLLQAEALAKSRATAALDVLLADATPGQMQERYPKFRTQSPASYRDYVAFYYDVQSRLVRVINGFRANQYGVEAECSCDEGVEAYVRPGLYPLIDDDIHICPIFYTLNAEGQASTFFHEMSHVFAGTDDDTDSPPYANAAKNAHFLDDLIDGDPGHKYNFVARYLAVVGLK